MARVRTNVCDRGDAKRRLDQARSFLEAAELFRNDHDHSSGNVSAANAVHAAIAASDAACCAALGRHAQGQDHQQAADLLSTVTPGGADAARALLRALAHKTNAAYGLTSLSKRDQETAIRQAEKLVAFAQETLERG